MTNITVTTKIFKKQLPELKIIIFIHKKKDFSLALDKILEKVRRVNKLCNKFCFC